MQDIRLSRTSLGPAYVLRIDRCSAYFEITKISCIGLFVCLMMFNASFNNISVIYM